MAFQVESQMELCVFHLTFHVFRLIYMEEMWNADKYIFQTERSRVSRLFRRLVFLNKNQRIVRREGFSVEFFPNFQRKYPFR